MPYKIVRNEQNLTKKITYPEGASDQQILDYASRMFGGQFQIAEPSLLGGAGALAKGTGAGAASTVLGAAQGPTAFVEEVAARGWKENLADATSAVLGALKSDSIFDKEGKYLGLEERDKVEEKENKDRSDAILGAIGGTRTPESVINSQKFLGQGIRDLRKSIVESDALAVDPEYQDHWSYKFGNALGSLGTFASIGLATRGKGPKAELVLPAFSVATGAGDQAERIARAREEGKSVDTAQALQSLSLGAAVGLTELAPVERLFKGLPKDLPAGFKNQIVARLKNALVTGGAEGTQEVAASLLQDLIERRIYNESLPFGQTMADDFTYGAAAGFAADLVLNAVAGRRSSLSTEEDLDYEKELRDEEDKQAQKYISSLTTPPVAPTPDQEIDPAQIAAPTQEDLAASVTTIDGNRGPVERVQFGTLYASRISQALGDQFPSGIKFDVVEDQDQEGMDVSFRVVDETGKQYGQRLASRRQANALSGNLNRISVDNAVAKSARDIVSSDRNAYTPEQAEQAFRLAYRALHPEYNTFGTLAVNQAAGTTAENGYREDLNYKTILAGQEIKKRGKVVGYEITAPNGKKSIVKGLTAAQQINKKRDEQGLGQARRFSKEEVTSALGKKADNLIGTFRPTQRWRAVSRRDGTYGIVSESGEFISRRPLTAREVDQRARTPEGRVSSVVPMTLGRGRAKGFVRSTEGGAPVNLGDGMVRIGSMKEARDFAQRMNSSSPPTTSIREVVGDTPTVKSYLKALKDVLRAKNITSRTKSEEMKSLFKLITGKESLAQMNEFERGLVYQRIRSLPRFDSQTALPNLSPRSFTPTQLARASRFIKDSDNRGVRYTPLDVAQAAGVAPSSSDVASIGTDLINEYKSQSPKAVPLLLPSPDSFGPNPLDSLLGSLKSVLKGYGFGDLKLSLGQTLVDPSGKLLGEETNAAYERYTKTLLFAVDRIDPNGALTPAQQEAALVDLLNHEVVHAARALDLWTEQEWSLLEKAVSRLKPAGSDTTYLENAINLYPDANPVVQIEEAVAELVRNYINNKKTVSGKPENLIKRFLSFMQRLSSAIRGTGFNTYQDVIDLLESGQLGARERGVVRTQRLGEEQRAQQGALPERLRPIISAVSAPSAPPPPERRGAGDFFADLPKEYTERVEPEQEPSPVVRRSVRTKYVDGEPVAVVEIDGVDRPVNNALGSPIHQTLEGIKNFWRWFGDSQLVDYRGRPIVFYHGTARDIDQFRPKQADAVFGSPSVRFAESFAEASLDWMNANYDQVFTSDQMIKSSRDMIERYKRLSSDVEAQIDSIARDEYKNAESSGASGFVTKGIYDIFFGENGAINKLKKSASLRIGRMESAIKSFEENIKDIDAQIKKNLAIPAGKRTQKDDDDLNLLEEQRKERNSTLQSSMRLGIEGGPPVQIAQVEVDNSPLFFAENLKDADNKSLSSLRYMSVNLLNRVRLSASLKATDVIDLSVKEAMPSGPNIIPLYFAPKNIFDYENESHLDGLADYLIETGANGDYASNLINSVRNGNWKEIESLYVQRYFRSAGYDSFFVKENEEKNIAVYNNAAVKSALGNNGQFSPETPVIRESRTKARSVENNFDPSLIEESRVPADKSREKLIQMPISQFLALARDEKDIDKLIKARSLLESGKKFSSLPILQIDADGRVEGHDGRHRARALQEAGYDAMPVIIRSANIRWSEQQDPKLRDYREFPKYIRAEIGAADENYTVPFPVLREQSMQPYSPVIRESRSKTLSAQRAAAARIAFEVAPDPNDVELTALWRQLPQQQRLDISDRVARAIVPMVMKFMNAKGKVLEQVGSYLEDTNPSFALRIDSGDVDQLSKILGFVLSQDSMMAIAPNEFPGSFKSQALRIEIGSKSAAEIDEIYQALRAITLRDGRQPIAGQSASGGIMTVLLDSQDDVNVIGALVDNALANAYTVTGHDVFAAFPEKQEYDYALPESDPAGDEGLARKRARDARAQASYLLRKELDAAQATSATAPQQPLARIRESRRADTEGRPAPDSTSIRQAPEPHPITSIGLLDGTETAPRMQSGSHVARFLQNRAIQILGGPLDIKQESAREFVAEAIASEAIAEMARKEEALEWYDTTVETMIENLSIQFPEILTDSNSRTALLVSIAVTSQNMAVPDNLRAGVEIYSGWRRTGLFPEKGFGAKAPAIKNNFEKANAIIQYLNGNGNGMADFAALLNDSYTVRELNDILNRILPGTKIGGERLDTRVYGSAVLGPKIGQGFYSNLRGEFSPVTIDMWFMRMIGRLTGTLTKYNPTLLDDQLVRLARASGLDQVSQESLTDEIRNDLISLSEETLSQHERNFKQFRAEYDSGVRTKSDAVKISERIKANLKGMNDAPTSPVQRDNLRDIVERARAKLKDYTGMDIPAASLQALVWYPEQRLHKNLGAKLRVTETDYAKSSRAFLLNQGVSESDLDAAERRVRQRRESGSGRVRPGDVAADTGAEQGVRAATGAPVLREARRTPISKDVEQAAFDTAKRIADETPPGGIPLYNLNATRFSLAVAQNPQISTPLSSDESIRFSRNRPPRLSSQESGVIDRLTGDPVVRTTPGQAYIAATGLGKVTATLNMLRKEMVNRYAGIEYYERTDPRLVGNLADSSALAALEFRDRYKGIFASAITDGVVSYVPVQDAQGNVTGYVTKVVDFYHNGKKMAGLIDVMKPLFDNDYGVNLENLAQSYAIAIRAERLAKEGKETPAKAGDLAIIKAAVDKYLNAKTGRPIIEEWYETWQAYNSKIVDFLEATGVIDSKGADLWRDQADYVPFYREIAVGSNNEALVRAPKIFGGMTSAAGFTRLKGGDTGVNVPLLDSILRNYEAAISMGMSNVAQQRVVRDMLTIGMAEMLRFNEDANGKDVVSFKFKGQKVRAYIKDPVVYQSLQNVDPGFLDSAVFNVVFRKPAEVVRELITREPAYMLANMMRDSISAWQNTGADIIPVVSTATALFSNPIEALRKYGIVNGYDFGADPSDVVNFFSKEAFKQGIDIPTEKRATSDMITQSLAMKPIMLLWDALGGMSAMSEAASRKAVYDSVLRETGNEAEAAYQALRVINYSRRGNNKALRFITSSVPFMNARIQGLDVMYMAASGRFGAKRSSMSKGKIASSFLIRGAMLTALSMYYYLLVSDTEEYKEATEEDRDNYYIIPVVKGDKENGVKGYSFYIPKPFENGLIFSTIPERIMASIDGLYTTKESRDFALRAIGNTLAMNPLPQVAKPVIESVSNTSFFTGRPIVPVFEQMNKLPYLQYRPTTNEAARLVSRELAERGLADISPMKIEHVARGYFGTLGTYVLNAVDSITRSATGADLPSRRIVDYPIVRRFVRKTGESGLENQFYKLRTNVDQIVGSLKKLQEEGRIDEYNAMMRSKGGLVQVKRWVLKTEQRLSKLRNYKNAIMTNQNYDPDTRREMVDQIDEQMRMVVSDIEIARRMAYGTEPSESMEGLRQSVR